MMGAVSVLRRLSATAILAVICSTGSACRRPPEPAASSKPAPTAAVATAPAAAATFVGREACANCHSDVEERWKGSHHDLAMQEATAKTVLGDFRNATFRHYGVTSTFFQKDGKFFVR